VVEVDVEVDDREVHGQLLLAIGGGHRVGVRGGTIDVTLTRRV
jgi:hypothetical protein